MLFRSHWLQRCWQMPVNEEKSPQWRSCMMWHVTLYQGDQRNCVEKGTRRLWLPASWVKPYMEGLTQYRKLKCLFPFFHHTKRTIILPCPWCPPYFLYNGPARVTVLRWSHTCRCSTSANPKLHNSSSWGLFMGAGRVADILCPSCVFCNFCFVCHVRACLDCCYPSTTCVACIRFLLLLLLLRSNRKSVIAGPVSTDNNSNCPYEFCKWVSSRERWYNHKNKTRNSSSK